MAKEDSPSKYLRNINTGVVCAYHPAKASLPFMEPCDELPEPRKVNRQRKLRPFDEARRAKDAAPREDAAVEDEISDSGPSEALLTPEELDEAEQKVSSALKKDDIAEVGMEYFGVEIDKSTDTSRAQMKEQVNALIEKARESLENG